MLLQYTTTLSTNSCFETLQFLLGLAVTALCKESYQLTLGTNLPHPTLSFFLSPVVLFIRKKVQRKDDRKNESRERILCFIAFRFHQELRCNMQ